MSKPELWFGFPAPTKKTGVTNARDHFVDVNKMVCKGRRRAALIKALRYSSGLHGRLWLRLTAGTNYRLTISSMVSDPLGLAGKTRDIEQVPFPEKKTGAVTVACVRADKTVTIAGKMAAVNAVLRAARAEKKRRDWDFVD